jgi:hypothetical protein
MPIVCTRYQRPISRPVELHLLLAWILLKYVGLAVTELVKYK